jgi:diguanylate cyclase (GGDEF)-like protein
MAILIVDDSPEMRRMISTILRRSGHQEVLTAATAGEAFRILGLEGGEPAADVDVVLMDLMMPEVDGIEACRRIKADERLEDVLVLMVTATAEESCLREAFAAGASDYLHKPFKPVVLLARVENALRLKRETDRRKVREAELLAMREQLEAANETLRRLADMDGLTGIGNRRSFEDYLEREWRRNRREKQPLSLIMADIDHFKLFNDTYGHPAGDDCLKRVAGAFETALQRGGDRAFRYGGEELAILLPNTSLDGALQVAEALRAAIAALRLPHETSPVDPMVTISLGVACTCPSGENAASELVEAADRALYRAKQGGRNALRVAEA